MLGSIAGRSKPKRVVLDTNVLIAAAWNEECASRQIVEACLQERTLRAVTSPSLTSEYKLILKRAARKSRYRKSLERFIDQAEKVECDARSLGIEVPADPEDAKVLATAIAGKVDALVGNDHHLLDLAPHALVPIMRPSHFLRQTQL